MRGAAVLEPRALCGRCRRPSRVCVCALLPALSPKTPVLILQHPRERKVAIGTAAMASRCLQGSTLVVGTHLEAHPKVRKVLDDPTRRAVLLWPDPEGTDLSDSPPEGPATLIVVDGTWSTAKKLLKLNPSIAALPRHALTPAGPSEYRIRKEPRAECLSTIEAISTALGIIEGDPERYRAMLAPFRAMVDAQLAHIAEGPNHRDRSKLMLKRRKVWSAPEALQDASRVAIVAVECNAWPGEEKAERPDEIVQWLSVRGDGSGAHELMVKPSGPLAPRVERHTELDPAALLGGEPREALAATVRQALADVAAFVTWGTYATKRIREEGLLPDVPVFDLRRQVADARRRSPGSIDLYVESLGSSFVALGQGRGGRRLGQMLATYRDLLSRSRHV